MQIKPYWAPSLRYLSTIGAHRFYTFGGKAGRLATFRFAYRGGEPNAVRLKRTANAAETSSAPDPVALQNAYDNGSHQPGIKHAAAQAPHKPVYTPELKERGGDTLYRGEKLPEATGIRPEYRNSGKWITRPGT